MMNDVQFGTVKGTFQAVGADTTDAGFSPDVHGDTGLEVLFVPSVKRVTLTGEHVRVVNVEPVQARVNDLGVLVCANGGDSVPLMATNGVEGANPETWHWTAVFNRRDWEDMDFTLAPGQTVDLAALTPVPTAPDTVKVADEALWARVQGIATDVEALAVKVEAATAHVLSLERGLKGDKGDKGEPGVPGRDGVLSKEVMRAFYRGMNEPSVNGVPSNNDDPLAMCVYVKDQEIISALKISWNNVRPLPGVDNMFRFLRGAERITDQWGNELSIPEELVATKDRYMDMSLVVPDDWPVFGYVWMYPKDRRENVRAGSGYEPYYPTEIRNLETSNFNSTFQELDVSFEAVFRVVEGNELQLDPSYPVSNLRVEGASGSQWESAIVSQNADELVVRVSGKAYSTESGELDMRESWENRENFRVLADQPVLIYA